MPPKVASRIIRAKKKDSVEPESKVRKPASSVDDWEREEAAELPPMKKGPDIVNEALGRDVYLSPYTASGWKTKAGRTIRVSRFYPHTPCIVFDKPATAKECEDRAEFFAGLGLVYLGLKPDEALTPDELRDRLVKQLNGKSMNKAA